MSGPTTFRIDMHLPQRVGAALLALAGSLTAHAEIDFNIDGSVSANARGTSLEPAAPLRGPSATDPTVDPPSLGGAIFNPFSDMPKSGATVGVQVQRKPPPPPPGEDAGFGLTFAAGLAGSLLLLWLLRRSTRTHLR
jgi:hypothetical protein